MKIVMTTGISLDGYMGTTQGIPTLAVMPDFVPAVSYGLDTLLADVTHVIVGRNVFDAGYAYWASNDVWSWPGYHVCVITSQPLPEPCPPEVSAPPPGC